MKKTHLILSLLLYFSSSSQQKGSAERERHKIANEMDSSIRYEMLNKWYPQNIDTPYGGFVTTFTYDFQPQGSQDKFIVTQARHTWTTAKASEAYPEQKYYLQCSKHGFQFLRDVMWDKEYGGFYSLVDRTGKDKSDPAAPKTAYGNAFGIYALAAYYKAAKDPAALDLAKRAFLWLEKGSHDPQHKGYFQHLNRDGTPVIRTASVPVGSDLGYKDQNSSIHLLEAFTELYQVWPDSLLRRRLEEMLYLVRDVITTRRGNLTLFLTRDWKPVSFRDSSEAFIRKNKNLDHVSFGHDVETAYLMLEASHALGIRQDIKTLAVGKRMVDHALVNGWDKVLGGFYNEGYYFRGRKSIAILYDSKNWWAQAEGLNTLLLMADLFPGDRMRYYDKFKQLWNYCNTYLIDHQYGDWYSEGLDKEPGRKTDLKGHIWKATYHQYRSLSNCVTRLRHPIGKEPALH